MKETRKNRLDSGEDRCGIVVKRSEGSRNPNIQRSDKKNICVDCASTIEDSKNEESFLQGGKVKLCRVVIITQHPSSL